MKGFFSTFLLVASFLAATVQAAPAPIDKRAVAALPPRTGRCRVHGGGHGDQTPSLLAAFKECQKDSVILLDGYFQIKTLLVTPHLSNVEIRLAGAFNYSDDFSYWSTPTFNTAGPGSYNLVYQNATTFFLVSSNGSGLDLQHFDSDSTAFVWFSKQLSGDNVWFHGDNVAYPNSGFLGNGQRWWNQFAIDKAAGNTTVGPLFARPIMLAIGNSTNMIVENLSLLQGLFWNIFLGDSHNVTIQNIKINAVSASKYFIYNTDGIDVYRSSSVKLVNWNVNNGDDCVSLKPNSTEVEIGNMVCNGSHGISVGSLGQYRGQTDIVQNVNIHNISMSNAQAGARIKVWPNSPFADPASGGGLGFVKNITFKNFVNNNVDAPLIITSCYNYQQPGKQKNVVGVLDCSNFCTSISATGTNLTLPLPKFAGVTPVYNCTHIRDETPLDFKCTDV
ncbi:BZ3500_MvSof-1268-A1-R1_Chr9g10416 [Microbotryum saponariae]|uniref:galacturonan 1,4-alpha-galacturonidase n=1 Tax=Microbotryum saponariae TaxID=289078 RepID=A0A2X0L6E3_9BASI|nr:BZ3501_MvSof-1269-A2-R1_Chr9g10166 [Microbotryum saponariae]SDA00058.1 BZ3500_MvSof-1268-A1-R1_Chr9g10416 [Microbotryum saponariae]